MGYLPARLAFQLVLYCCYASQYVFICAHTVHGILASKTSLCTVAMLHSMSLFTHSTWDTLYYTQSTGSLVANIPHFFNISLCGSLRDSQCSANSSVCYSSELSTFYNLGNTSSCQYRYDNRSATFTYSFSSEDRIKQLYGIGNVSVTLICGRTLVSC